MPIKKVFFFFFGGKNSFAIVIFWKMAVKNWEGNFGFICQIFYCKIVWLNMNFRKKKKKISFWRMVIKRELNVQFDFSTKKYSALSLA